MKTGDTPEGRRPLTRALAVAALFVAPARGRACLCVERRGAS